MYKSVTYHSGQFVTHHAAAPVVLTFLYNPPCWIIGKVNLHTFILVRIIFEMHAYSIFKLEYYKSVANNLTTLYSRIHDVVKSRFWPFTLFPMGYENIATIKAYWRGNRKINCAECELDIELANTHLCREFTDNGT